MLLKEDDINLFEIPPHIRDYEFFKENLKMFTIDNIPVTFFIEKSSNGL